MSKAHSTVLAETPVPEILAPVGGREQFFAALNSGADAVFLGLKNFNARARAENFTLDDLRELVPVANQHGMNVLVTMNILIKNAELPQLIETLAALEDIGVHAIIVQDVGLARLCRTYFPNLRMHASTQLAVHNLDGVRAAMELGFKRVVLARELTAVEIKRIRAAIPRNEVELEAFCHGSLCYSYSGLCFFSGAEDARSGNRGECAYTCRKPYKILNEPGHGFLFSMKDLNTIESLELLVDAGVDTLKIEGRKKDAQYVTSVVQAYRNKLDKIFERPTLRNSAPAMAHALNFNAHDRDKQLEEQLSLSFQRSGTSFFLKGRYHENVIDLDNPTHKGQHLGNVLAVRDRKVALRPSATIERFDGLRIDPSNKLYHSLPQHGQHIQTKVDDVRARYQNEICHFSLRNMFCEGRMVPLAEAGTLVEIEIPEELPLPEVGDFVYRTRSDALRRNVEKLTRVPADSRLRPKTEVQMHVSFKQDNERVSIHLKVLKHDQKLFSYSQDFAAIRPKNGISSLQNDLNDSLSTLGNIGFVCTSIHFQGDSEWFVPRSQLKELKRAVEARLPGAHQAFLRERLTAALESVRSRQLSANIEKQTNSNEPSGLSLKIDRLEYLPWILEFLAARPNHSQSLRLEELVFEPKRAFLPELNFADVISALKDFANQTGSLIRFALPTVLRGWDEPLIKRWAQEFFAAGITAVEVGNVGHFAMLERWGLKESTTSLSSDFTLYSLNQEAAAQWNDWGVKTIALSIEDDVKNIRNILNALPQDSQPQVILYKDTPLFIAESCSLTALHNGCPTNAVCGYRTLKIQNDAGEIFYVAHESCKSIVYAEQPFAVSHHRKELEQQGVKAFRVDFLTRAYDQSGIQLVLAHVYDGIALPNTHTANFNRTLL